MNFDKMNSQQIVDYASISNENHIEVIKWMRNKYKKQIKYDKRCFIIWIIALTLAILSLILRLSLLLC